MRAGLVPLRYLGSTEQTNSRITPPGEWPAAEHEIACVFLRSASEPGLSRSIAGSHRQEAVTLLSLG